MAALVAQDGGGPFYWIGGLQPDPYSAPGLGWAWVTGQPWGYINWASGEPNDYAGVRESHLAMWGVFGHDVAGTWNDEGYIATGQLYVVEYDLPSADCNDNGIPDPEEIGSGTSADCNGVPDDQDAASGGSEDRNGNGIPDECEEPGDRRAVRSFAGGCVANRELTVIIDVWLDASAGTYALEERPPAGWTVLGISHDGVFDSLTGKVKWGPFFDGEEMQERFWYSLYLALPQVEPEAEFCLGPGTLSVDGENLPIEGQACVAACWQHPADDDGNWQMVIDEVTSYGHCWQQGCEWALLPVPIPIGYVTRAGFLWRNGESYCRHPDIEPPLCWVPCSGEDSLPQVVRAAGPATAPARAERAIALAGQPDRLAVSVALTVTPAAGAAAYALEEALPAGWAVTQIDQTGSNDPTTGRLKWGPFLDSKPRTVLYSAEPWAPQRGPQLFAGTVSADGLDQPVEGVWCPPASWGAADGDADEIPDGWEILRGLATGVKNEGDSDGDGALDLEEYVAGTDPLDGSDMFAIESVQIVHDELVIGIKGRAGRRYRLLSGATAAQPLAEWEPLPLQVEAATDGEPVALAIPLADLQPGRGLPARDR